MLKVRKERHYKMYQMVVFKAIFCFGITSPKVVPEAIFTCMHVRMHTHFFYTTSFQ